MSGGKGSNMHKHKISSKNRKKMIAGIKAYWAKKKARAEIDAQFVPASQSPTFKLKMDTQNQVQTIRTDLDELCDMALEITGSYEPDKYRMKRDFIERMRRSYVFKSNDTIPRYQYEDLQKELKTLMTRLQVIRGVMEL